MEKAVYIVDDDPAVRRSTSFFLTTAGFKPQPYSSGRDFLDDVPALAPGCVLLDIRMPDLDGLQVIESFGQHMAKLPVVVMTGHGDVEIAVKAMKLGAIDFLQKPFEESVMLEVLEREFSNLGEQVRGFEERAKAQQLIKRLTPRETEVLRGLIGGLSNKVLAFELDLSTRTIEMHRAHMMGRLGAKSLSDALSTAFAAGLTGL